VSDSCRRRYSECNSNASEAQNCFEGAIEARKQKRQVALTARDDEARAMLTGIYNDLVATRVVNN
jgi:hypothetical protein